MQTMASISFGKEFYKGIDAIIEVGFWEWFSGVFLGMVIKIKECCEAKTYKKTKFGKQLGVKSWFW